MLVKIWGVRGSVPTPITNKQFKDKVFRLIKNLPKNSLNDENLLKTHLNSLPVSEFGVIGGNTSCVEVSVGNQLFIFDMGTGIIKLGNHIVKNLQNKKGMEIHIFLSHTHWDHIMGLPYFKPLFFPKNTINFYSPHPNFEKRIRLQQDFRFFPVSLDKFSSKKRFITLKREAITEINDVKITNFPQNHPGGSFGYKIEHDNKKFIYCTDTEYQNLHTRQAQTNLIHMQNSDLMIFDAQYTFEEAIHKEDWGHSSALVGIDMAIEANIKKLLLFHHEPDRNDSEIVDIFQKAKNYLKMNFPDSKLEIGLATEELEITL